MFEKEAEEYYEDVTVGTFQECTENFADAVLTAYTDGAEFGYNKAKEEMQKNGLALQSDMDKTIEQNIALKKQIEKMKCCGNCIHEINEDEIIVQTGHCDNCFEFCNWKLRR